MPFVIASSVPASNEPHWMVYVSLSFVALLTLFSIYLTFRVILTKAENLQNAPRHIQYAQPILMWITVACPLLILFGCCFHYFEQILEIGSSGRFDIVQPYLFLGEFLIFLEIALGSALLAWIGVALVGWKRARKAFHGQEQQ